MSDPIDIEARRKTNPAEDELGEIRAQKTPTPLRRIPQRNTQSPWSLSDREEAYRHAYLTGRFEQLAARQHLAVVEDEEE